ncbi:MAG: alpha/beta fold hydrolase, partial [Asgard group archaeon]|nr:alpha/beta fold hydrolase [Asgard group archaeon]
METKKIKVNGITIRYLDIKNDDKDTIVFLHYGGSTLAVWNGVIPYFQNDYRIIAADLRGHGHSEKPETNYHIDDMAKDIFELMNALDVKQAHIIGSSLGADVAISITANYPEKVLSMILDGGFYDLVGPDSKAQTIS